MKIYKKKSERRKEILTAASQLARDKLFTLLTRAEIAEAADMVPANVSRVMGTMSDLRDDLIEYAINNTDYNLIAQAIVAKHRHAAGISDKIKCDCLKSL